jgi:hypothetical protein
VLRLVNTVSYRAEALGRFPSRAKGSRAGFLFATLATCARSLPFRSTQFPPFGGTLLFHSMIKSGVSPRSEEPPAAPLGTGSHARIRCRIYEA